MKAKSSNANVKRAQLSLRVKPGPASVGARSAEDEAGLLGSFLKLRHILVPVDFSEFSEKALRYGVRFAEQFGSKITLLHVIQPVVYPADFGFPPAHLEGVDSEMRRQAEEKLEEYARGAAMRVATLVRLGQPYLEITSAAKELDVDLVIITTHGRTGLRHVLLGSTAERVVRHAPCPVLTLREREHDFVS